MNYRIAVIPGDGIGPEIVGEAKKVLDAVGKKFGHQFTYTEVLMGCLLYTSSVSVASSPFCGKWPRRPSR